MLDDKVKECLLVLAMCKETWKISDLEMVSIMEKHNLGKLFADNYDVYTTDGYEGMLQVFETHIKATEDTI